jgi:uncharacterized protein
MPQTTAIPDRVGDSRPRVPNAHLFHADGSWMVLEVDGGGIYELDDPFADALGRAADYGDADRVGRLMAVAAMGGAPRAPDPPPASVPLRALSLAIAQKCNMSCAYCYAEQGGFGGPARNMPPDVARASVDRLLSGAASGDRVTLAFLGGEPLINRQALRAAAEYAARRAADAGVRVAFALTTNGTLLDRSDADFFDRYAFDVTISIDGTREAHNRLRLLMSGEGSYERVMERARLLLERPGRSCTVRARASVTPQNLAVRETLDELIRLGFDGVHLAPVLHSPTGAGEMSSADLGVLLERMIECALVFERKVLTGEHYPFQNAVSTLRRIHGYARDTYPCGAGGGYMGVSAAGELFACHRFVDDEVAAMGTVGAGVDARKQAEWLAGRHVLAQEPCRTCWARHLCGGGCHHEAIHRGRPACDYIRGWLHHCLGAYVRLLKARAAGLARVLGNALAAGG